VGVPGCDQGVFPHAHRAGRAYGHTMHSLSSTSNRHSAFGEPSIVERSRGTAHPHGAMTTRDRVARSLLLRPDAPARPLTRR
jgi:hypothetical protein